MKYLKWLYWNIYYFFVPPKDGMGDLSQWLRCNLPKKFKPNVFDNGVEYEVFVKNETSYYTMKNVRVDVGIGMDSGEVTGFSISKKELKKKDGKN